MNTDGLRAQLSSARQWTADNGRALSQPAAGAQPSASAPPPISGQQYASVLSARFGGYEDTNSYGDGAGRAAPAVPGVYESLVVGQGAAASKTGPLLKIDRVAPQPAPPPSPPPPPPAPK